MYRRITAQDLDAELYDLIFSGRSESDKGAPKRIISARERQLREKAQGRSRDVFRAASTVFVPEASEFISKLFDKKFDEQEREQAKEQLKSEFGVDLEKEGKPKNPFGKIAKSLNKSIKRIEDALVGVKAAVDSINDNINTNLVDRIVRSNKSMTEALMVIAGVKNPAASLKPETIEMNNQEYLYYKGAPEGRQFYQKSAKGTAGRIASKKEQKSLQSIVNRVARKKKTPMIKAIDDATMTMSKDYVTKKDLEKFIEDINMRANTATAQLTDMEQKKMLYDALLEALQKIIEKNPNLFKSQTDGGGILDILGAGAAGAGIAGVIAKGAAAGGSAIAGIKAALAGGGLASVAVAGGAAAITGGGLLAMDKSMRSRADSTIEKIATTGSVSDIKTMLEAGTPQQKAYKLQQIKMIAQQNPEVAAKLTQVIGPTAMAASGQPQMQTPAAPALTPTEAGQTLVPTPQAPTSEIAAQNIINQNRINRDTQRISTMVNNQQSPVVNNITNNNVMPQTSVMERETNKYANQDNTFNRLVAQDFDSPYSNPMFGF